MGRRKSGFDIRPCACPAWGGYSLLIVARHAVAAAGTGSDLAKGPYPVVVTAAVAAAEPVTGHGVIYVTALHVDTREALVAFILGLVSLAPRRNCPPPTSSASERRR